MSDRASWLFLTAASILAISAFMVFQSGYFTNLIDDADRTAFTGRV